MKYFAIFTCLLVVAILQTSCSDVKKSDDIRGVYDVTEKDEKGKNVSETTEYLYIQDSTIAFNFQVNLKTDESNLTKIKFVTGDIHSGGTYHASSNCSKKMDSIEEMPAWTPQMKAKIKQQKLSGNEASLVIAEIQKLEKSQCSDRNAKAFIESTKD